MCTQQAHACSHRMVCLPRPRGGGLGLRVCIMWCKKGRPTRRTGLCWELRCQMPWGWHRSLLQCQNSRRCLRKQGTDAHTGVRASARARTHMHTCTCTHAYTCTRTHNKAHGHALSLTHGQVCFSQNKKKRAHACTHTGKAGAAFLCLGSSPDPPPIFRVRVLPTPSTGICAFEFICKSTQAHTHAHTFTPTHRLQDQKCLSQRRN